LEIRLKGKLERRKGVGGILRKHRDRTSAGEGEGLGR